MPNQKRYGFHFTRSIHRVVWIGAFSCSAAWPLSAQELERIELRDTVVKKPVINQSLIRNFYTDTIDPKSQRDSSDYPPLSLHESLTNLPSSLSSNFQQQIDVVSPWKQELTKQNKFRTLKTILGAVQAGGTAYLLYEHIRKYGLK